MPIRIPKSTTALVLAFACQSYEPAPVDLAAHARAFEARLPEAPLVRAFVEQLLRQQPPAPAFDPSDGLERHEAQALALLFNADLRQARLRAGVAGADADNAGLWADPELGFDLTRILESVDHPWIVAGRVGLTLPITGRPGLEKALADAEHGATLIAVRAAEARLLDAVDVALAEWSTALVASRELDAFLGQIAAVEAIAQRLATAQEITQLDARVFTLERTARQAERIALGARLQHLELELHKLLGLTPAAEVSFVPWLVPAPRAPAEGRQATATNDGPRIALARAEHATSEHRLELAIRKQWPELTLLPGFGEEDAQPRASLGFSLPIPLWNGNAREIAVARAEREAKAEALRAELERVVQELFQAELALRAAGERRRLLEDELVPLVDRQLEDGRRLFELGTLDTLLILDGLVRAHTAKTALLEARLDELRAASRLDSFFWPAWSTTGVEAPR